MGMEVEWRFCGLRKEVVGCREGLEDNEGWPVGVVGAAQRSEEGSMEPVARIGHEERAHKIDGAPKTRRWSGLGVGAMKSQNNCTMKAIAQR